MPTVKVVSEKMDMDADASETAVAPLGAFELGVDVGSFGAS